uniref:Retrotransposon gag domain-containing protein n=1 Tax=Vitis vinifera TaxID=29760 RepID=A5BXW0_VITVI|nr:hypothetical protein VITISV_044391 [Vitis vinifera]
MESENPYAHIKEFEEVCNTFREGGASIDLMRLKLFPFTLKDKAKIWLNSLRPRSIRNWVDLQAEFLKKFFPTHRTNGLKRQISNFSAKENEKFHECWERYMEAINACPHHGFDTWLLVSYFYDGNQMHGCEALLTAPKMVPERALKKADFVAKGGFRRKNYFCSPFRSCETPCGMELWLRNLEFSCFGALQPFRSCEMGAPVLRSGTRVPNLVSQLRKFSQRSQLSCEMISQRTTVFVETR